MRYYFVKGQDASSYEMSCYLFDRSKLCGICGKDLTNEFNQLTAFAKRRTGTRKYINIDIDHILPKSLGGHSNVENLQLAHMTCNRRKGNGGKLSIRVRKKKPKSPPKVVKAKKGGKEPYEKRCERLSRLGSLWCQAIT